MKRGPGFLALLGVAAILCTSPAFAAPGGEPGRPQNPGSGSGSSQSGSNGPVNGNAPSESAGNSESSASSPSQGNANAGGNGNSGNSESPGASGGAAGSGIGNPNAGGDNANGNPNGNNPSSSAGSPSSNAERPSREPASNGNGNGNSNANANGNANAGGPQQSPRGQSAAERAVGRRALAAAENGTTDAEQANDAAVVECLNDALLDAVKTKSNRKPDVGRASAKKVRELESACEDEVGNQGDYLVTFAPGTDVPVAAARTKRGSAVLPENRFGIKKEFTRVVQGMAIRATAKQIERLRKDPSVVAVEPDGVVLATEIQTPAPWGLDRIDSRNLPLSGGYEYARAGAGVKAYVVDTGILATHSDFGGRVAGGYSTVGDGLGIQDCNGHGTHVAGTIAGATYGVAKGATIVPVRVLDCSGSGTWSGVIAGLDWIAAQHQPGEPAVANMSLGGGASSTVDSAVRGVIADGVTVVVAAGNSATDACTTSPARVAEAVTVAASNSSDAMASFSNTGTCVDVIAPGVSVLSAWYTGNSASATLSGTSMASPHVAGGAALLLEPNPSAAPSQVASLIVDRATSGVISGAGSTPNRLLFTGLTETPPPPPPAGTIPAAPTSVVAVGGSKSATVTWVQGSDGGSALTSHSITIYNDRGRVAGVAQASGAATSITISGLAPRKKYNFTVAAQNALGIGPASAMSNTIVTGR